MLPDGMLARHAGGYVAVFGGLTVEPDLLPLIPWLVAQGVGVAIFHFHGDVMEPYSLESEAHLLKGPLGAWVPDLEKCRPLSVSELGTVLVPGLAFSRRDGIRLGRGKGHYDRVLGSADFRGQTLGICYEMQILATLPREAHDVPVEALICEHGRLEFGR